MGWGPGASQWLGSIVGSIVGAAVRRFRRSWQSSRPGAAAVQSMAVASLTAPQNGAHQQVDKGLPAAPVEHGKVKGDDLGGCVGWQQ